MGSVDIRLVREDDISIYGDGLQEKVEHDGKEYFCPYYSGIGEDVHYSDYGEFKRLLSVKVYSWFSGFHKKETFFGQTLLCGYCAGSSHGEVEIAIRKISVYRKPPLGAKNLNILSQPPFYALRINRALAYCKKCEVRKETSLLINHLKNLWMFTWEG